MQLSAATLYKGNHNMNRKIAENWLCLSGIIAVIFYFLHIILGTMHYPGYNNLAQAVSDLTAMDSPSYMIASRFTTIYGALSCLCCTIAFLLLNKSEKKVFRTGILLYTIMNWISFTGYTLFPLSGNGFQGTVQDIFHFYVVTISVVILAIASLIMIFIGGIKVKRTQWISICSLTALFFMCAGSIGTGIVPREYFGLAERLSTFSVVIFTGLLGYFGFLYDNTAKKA